MNISSAPAGIPGQLPAAVTPTPLPWPPPKLPIGGFPPAPIGLLRENYLP
ncbi:hypothetical protein A2U01_0010197 [Trifolium medium]|uniref:Uncharacterized protein n=1 Tax=Trifolium medium TaxID=97028 RepID=A0A392MP35_9FABA|nr:hypothetical protein [Trifolium medium]